MIRSNRSRALVVLLAVLALIAAACGGGREDSSSDEENEAAAESTGDEAAAFKRAHLPGAVNVPVEELEARLADLEELAGRPILYCRSGDKSKEAAAKLGELGFPVAYLEGGLLSWEADSLPIERG